MHARTIRPRNFTRRADKLAQADVFVVSIPKSGRTWLRFFLRQYFCRSNGIPFTIRPGADEPGSIPRIRFSHDLWAHVTAPRRWDRVTGLHLIPPAARRRAKIILVARDLRDVMVSLHLQLTRRRFASGASFAGTQAELIRDRIFGAERAVEIQNQWIAEWGGSERCLVWRYEACQADPMKCFRQVLDFLDVSVEEEQLRSSVESSSFDNMQRLERRGDIDDHVLQPGDPDDPESFKVRRGKAGGYRDYLDEDDIRSIECATAGLRL